jgi:hypothetical protein
VAGFMGVEKLQALERQCTVGVQKQAPVTIASDNIGQEHWFMLTINSIVIKDISNALKVA